MPSNNRYQQYDRLVSESLCFLGHVSGHPEQPIIYPSAEAERPHLAYYGTTRSGKTFAMEYALQQLARDRSAGFCFIDPHGSSYWRLASYLREHNIRDRVLYWDINDAEYVTSYDPFDVPDHSPAYIAGNLTAALLATLGRYAEVSEQAHLKTVTDAGLFALLSLGLPFALAAPLFDPGETAVKRAVAQRLREPNLLATIARLPGFHERYEKLVPPYRRLENLFRDDRLRITFTTGGVRFRQLLDEGWIVLVNTDTKEHTDEAAVLFTRLLVKSLFLAAKARHAADHPPPFFLAIDEASRYLTADTARILKETGKFSLYLMLGMQSIEDARRENEETYNAIRTCANAEVVLRLSDYDEQIYFARRFFGNYFDFKTIKHEQVYTAAIPRSVPHTTRSRSSPLGPTVTRTVNATTTELPSGDSSGSIGSSVAVSRAPDVEALNEGYHPEYSYEPRRELWYYTPDELERLAAQRFGVRPAGAEHRFGYARVNTGPPTEIEIPELPPPLYSRAEMVAYLRALKKKQLGTRPLADARAHYEALVAHHLEALVGSPRDPTTTARKPRPPRRPRET